MGGRADGRVVAGEVKNGSELKGAGWGIAVTHSFAIAVMTVFTRAHLWLGIRGRR